MESKELFFIVFLASSSAYFMGYTKGKVHDAMQKNPLFWSVGIGLVSAIGWTIIPKLFY